MSVTISIGASRGLAKCLKTMIAHADECLYQAKCPGRNRVVLYGPG